MNKQHSRRLASWQIVLVVLGVFLIVAPVVWDIMVATFDGLAGVRLEDIFTRGGMFVVGIVSLLVAGIYELVKDARDKPTSKYIK